MKEEYGYSFEVPTMATMPQEPLSPVASSASVVGGVTENAAPTWPAVRYETLPWERAYDDLTYISKTARRKISSTYEAAIPASIATAKITLPPQVTARAEALPVALARFDVQQTVRGYSLSALLLRSESAASSQIEHLTSSVRNVALAEIAGSAPHNALAIAGNIAAMRRALALSDGFGLDGIRLVHKALIESTDKENAGEFRQEQVWIGGSVFSPHGAFFVPPHYKRVEPCLLDLLEFSRREDMNAIVRAALAHAQFETIHPFTDGNGRTGRTLVHKMLRRDGVLAQVAMPLSAGLLHNVEAYMAALRAYQQGDPLPIINQMIDALELSLTVAARLALAVDEIFAAWGEKISERKTASIHELPRVLASQPVVNATFLAERLGITPRATNNLIDKACEYGMLERIGNSERNVFYQAPELIAVLEEASSTAGIRRILAK